VSSDRTASTNSAEYPQCDLLRSASAPIEPASVGSAGRNWMSVTNQSGPEVPPPWRWGASRQPSQ
jgi:hypothetical protein